jgi:hypothetical protein
LGMDIATDIVLAAITSKLYQNYRQKEITVSDKYKGSEVNGGTCWECGTKRELIAELEAEVREYKKLSVPHRVHNELKAENLRLKEEVRVLRQYGNKDCTAMADEALKGDNSE